MKKEGLKCRKVIVLFLLSILALSESSVSVSAKGKSVLLQNGATHKKHIFTVRESRDRATCRKPTCNWYRCQKRNGKGVQCSAYLGIYVGEPSKFHTYERVTTRRMGTCTKEGWQVEYCKYCTSHRTVTLPKHHIYTNRYRNNKAERYCSRCKQWISSFTSN